MENTYLYFADVVFALKITAIILSILFFMISLLMWGLYIDKYYKLNIFIPVVVTVIIAIGARYLSSLYMPLDTLLQFITIVVVSASIYIGIVITIYRLARTRLFLY